MHVLPRWGRWCTGGGGADFGGSQLGNFAFQIGRAIPHTESSGVCGSAPPRLQSPTHHNISGRVRGFSRIKARGFREISHSEMCHCELDLARTPPPPYTTSKSHIGELAPMALCDIHVAGTSQPGVFVMTAYRARIRPSGEDAHGQKLHSGFPPRKVDARGSADARSTDACLS